MFKKVIIRLFIKLGQLRTILRKVDICMSAAEACDSDIFYNLGQNGTALCCSKYRGEGGTVGQMGG